MSPDDAPREHFSNLADPPWLIVAGGQILGTGKTGTDAWRAVLAAAEAERDALRARAEAAEQRAEAAEAALAAMSLVCAHCGPESAGPAADHGRACATCYGTLILTDAAGAAELRRRYDDAVGEAAAQAEAAQAGVVSPARVVRVGEKDAAAGGRSRREW